MANTQIENQLQKYLSDALAIEKQALVQMKMAPGIAGDPALARTFEEHRGETEQHERAIAERLEARDGKASTVKNVVMQAGGVGFAMFAKLQPDSPGKLTVHAYSYEALEQASYELLAHVAERAGDEETAEVARRIRGDEEAMKERLAASFDVATRASLSAVAPDDLDDQLVKYLADAHALERQAIGLLERGPEIAGDSGLAPLLEEHLTETREHERLAGEMLVRKGGRRNALKDAALKLGALNWSGFFAAQPDTPGKLAAFAYAFEHLEVAAWELLKRVATEAVDGHAIRLAERIVAEEHAAAAKLWAQLDASGDASLVALGVA
jgi:ferritin-like metal-binding protein YciE